jgi:transposase
MVAQLLEHIDTLDAAIQNLSERIASVLASHRHVVERLCTIPGVHTHAAQVLIAECGLDMMLFPTVGQFASWAGACPGHHELARRRRSGRTRQGIAPADSNANSKGSATRSTSSKSSKLNKPEPATTATRLPSAPPPMPSLLPKTRLPTRGFTGGLS